MFRRAAVIGLAFAGLAVLGLAIAGSSSSADPRGCPPAGVGAEHANEHSRHYRCSTPTLTPTPASTPSPTATVTPTPLPTFSPTPSPPLSQTPTPTPLPTPSPPLTPIPTPTPTLPAGTPTPTPTPTLTPGPTPPFTFTNNTGTAASDLHFFAVAGESRPATLQVDNIVNPPGCPTPGVQVIGFTSIEPIFHVTLDWGEPCVDDGESATVDVSCTGPGTCTPTLFDGCADWTLSGTVIGTRCPFPPTPTPPPSPTP